MGTIIKMAPTFFYSKSLRLGFLEGSFERKPNVNREIKKITTVYTKIFKVNMSF